MSYRDEVNKVFASPHFDTISQRGFVLEAAARADAEIAKLLTELAEARSLFVDLNAAIKAAWDARNLPASVALCHNVCAEVMAKSRGK